ncbi:MAG: molybdenum cofactor biosynthesis protein MoaE [Candidatus Latescibacterota bacterium]
MFRIVEGEISMSSVLEAVEDETSGAVVTFVGRVRNHANGKRVVALEYEAHETMAERKLAEIGAEILQKWTHGADGAFAPIRTAIVHRVGHVKVGEASVVIAVSAPHRAEAFEACRYAIDRIKEIVPIWKKEIYEEGERWVGGERTSG